MKPNKIIPISPVKVCIFLCGIRQAIQFNEIFMENTDVLHGLFSTKSSRMQQNVQIVTSTVVIVSSALMPGHLRITWSWRVVIQNMLPKKRQSMENLTDCWSLSGLDDGGSKRAKTLSALFIAIHLGHTTVPGIL